jgi:hypothetical protein
MHIDSFEVLAPDTVLLDHQELVIDEIAAINAGDYYQSFLYIKTKPSTPSGLNDHSPIDEQVERRGFAREEFALFRDRVVSRAEFEDGSAVIDGKVVDMNLEAQLRVKYLSPYNLLIAPVDSPINNIKFDQTRVEFLNAILRGDRSLEALVAAVLELPKRAPRTRIQPS